jgi:hypothetical protein
MTPSCGEIRPLQASIVACHARARTAAETDRVRIAALHDALAYGAIFSPGSVAWTRPAPSSGAAALTRNTRERALLLARAAEAARDA